MQTNQPYSQSDFEQPGLFREWHFCGFCISVPQLAGLISLCIGIYFVSTNHIEGILPLQLGIYFSLIFTIFQMVNLCCFSRIYKALSNTKKHSETGQYIEQMKTSPTYCFLVAESYHYRHVRTKNGSGRRKVTTWRYEEKHTFTCVYDACRPFNDLNSYGVSMLNLKSVPKVFLSPEALQFIGTRKNILASMAKPRDRYYSVNEKIDVEGRIDNILSVSEGGTGGGICGLCTCCFNRPIFCIFSLFGLTWFYRMWTNLLLYKLTHEIVKYVSFNTFEFNQNAVQNFNVPMLPPPNAPELEGAGDMTQMAEDQIPQFDPNAPPGYGQTPQYGQAPQYGQPPVYGQPPQYGQPTQGYEMTGMPQQPYPGPTPPMPPPQNYYNNGTGTPGAPV